MSALLADVPTLGEIVRAFREAESLSQTELGRMAGIDPQTISNIEIGRTKRLGPKQHRNMAKAMGIKPAELSRQAGLPVVSLPDGIHPAPDSQVIPTWTIDLTASDWVDVPCARLDNDDPEQAAIIAAGRFRLTIMGRCMETEYPDGHTVEFQIVRADEPLEPGRDYAVCRSDGTATFKRLMRVDEDTMYLVALNEKDYPGVIEVPRQEVCRMARVLHRLTPPPPVIVPRR